jgi:hypothetical protein
VVVCFSGIDCKRSGASLVSTLGIIFHYIALWRYCLLVSRSGLNANYVSLMAGVVSIVQSSDSVRFFSECLCLGHREDPGFLACSLLDSHPLKLWLPVFFFEKLFGFAFQFAANKNHCRSMSGLLHFLSGASN